MSNQSIHALFADSYEVFVNGRCVHLLLDNKECACTGHPPDNEPVRVTLPVDCALLYSFIPQIIEKIIAASAEGPPEKRSVSCALL